MPGRFLHAEPRVYDYPVRIELDCPARGDNRFNLGDVLESDAVVLCSACGHPIGTLAELKE